MQDGGIFGRYGYDELTTSATANTGQWYAIKAVNGADATVTVVNTIGDNSTSLTIPSGDEIYVNAASITVSSGTVHAYRKG